MSCSHSSKLRAILKAKHSLNHSQFPTERGSGGGRGWELLRNVFNLYGQTNLKVSPSWGLVQRPCWGAARTKKKKKRSRWREGMRMMWLGWIGAVIRERKATLDLPCHHHHKGRWLVPNEPWPPFGRPLPSTKAAFGKIWSLRDWMTRPERIINDSNLVLAFSHHISFIQTSYSDEQCITQKYKGKILVLHYTFSKIYTE